MQKSGPLPLERPDPFAALRKGNQALLTFTGSRACIALRKERKERRCDAAGLLLFTLLYYHVKKQRG
jgi:hypothetical protein